MLNYLPALFILRRLALSVTSQRPFRWQKYTFLFEAQNNPADFLYTSNGKFIFHQRWRRYFLTLTLVSIQNCWLLIFRYFQKIFSKNGWRTAYFQYLCTMFVDRKKHRSGHVSIIVMDMSSGKLREVKNFGVAKSDSEADELYFEAKQWIRRYGGQLEMDFIDDEVKLREQEETTRVLSNIDSLLINGHRLILDQVYDSLGFNEIPDEILRNLVVARISQPMSKRATVEDWNVFCFDRVCATFKLIYYFSTFNKERCLSCVDDKLGAYS